jgi:hypothetical protein
MVVLVALKTSPSNKNISNYKHIFFYLEQYLLEMATNLSETDNHYSSPQCWSCMSWFEKKYSPLSNTNNLCWTLCPFPVHCAPYFDFCLQMFRRHRLIRTLVLGTIHPPKVPLLPNSNAYIPFTTNLLNLSVDAILIFGVTIWNLESSTETVDLLDEWLIRSRRSYFI